MAAGHPREPEASFPLDCSSDQINFGSCAYRSIRAFGVLPITIDYLPLGMSMEMLTGLAREWRDSSNELMSTIAKFIQSRFARLACEGALQGHFSGIDQLLLLFFIMGGKETNNLVKTGNRPQNPLLKFWGRLFHCPRPYGHRTHRSEHRHPEISQRHPGDFSRQTERQHLHTSSSTSRMLWLK
jgi:hypothetical protein